MKKLLTRIATLFLLLQVGVLTAGAAYPPGRSAGESASSRPSPLGLLALTALAVFPIRKGLGGGKAH